MRERYQIYRVAGETNTHLPADDVDKGRTGDELLNGQFTHRNHKGRSKNLKLGFEPT
jgi:hypothetical protein